MQGESDDSPKSGTNSSDLSGDGFLSWDRSKQSSTYRDNQLDARDRMVQHRQTTGLEEMQQMHGMKQLEQLYQLHPTSDRAVDDNEEKGMMLGPTPFRPMAPREFALGNTLRRSHPAMPTPTLPADATVARKGSQDGSVSRTSKSVEQTSTSVRSVSPSLSQPSSVEPGEIDLLQKMIQEQQVLQTQNLQKQNLQQQQLPQLPIQQHQSKHRRTSINASMERISERSGSGTTREESFESNTSAIEPSEQSAGQHAGGEGFQQSAGEAAEESPSSEQVSERTSSERNHVQNRNETRGEDLHTAGELLNEAVRKLDPELADAAAEAVVAAVVKSAERERNQRLGHLSEMSASELLVFEGDPMESWRQSHASHASRMIGDDDDVSIEDNINSVKEGVSHDGSIQIHSESSSSYSSYSSRSSATDGYVNPDDDEIDEDDVSYTIGRNEGLHPSWSVDESDMSETASEEEDVNDSISSSRDDENVAKENTNYIENPHQQKSVGGQYIDHYLKSKKEENTQEHTQTYLPLKRPLELGIASNEPIDNLTTSSVSTLSREGRFPLTSQAIATADIANTEESGAITARFNRLLQECRDLTETCGDSVTTSSFVDSTTRSSALLQSSSTTPDTYDKRLSSSQIKEAMALAAAKSASLQTRQYSNPVTQKQEIDTSDGKHLQISQLTIDPTLQSSIVSSDYKGSMMSLDYRASAMLSDYRASTMSMSEYRDLRQLNNEKIRESQSSETPQKDHLKEEVETAKEPEEDDAYAETFHVPIDSPFGKRSSEQPISKSIRSVMSELSLGVDMMYGDISSEENTSYGKSVNTAEDLTAPFDPSQFLSELDDSEAIRFEKRQSDFASTISDPDSQDRIEQMDSTLSMEDEVNKAPNIESNQAATAKETTLERSPDLLSSKSTKDTFSPVRQSFMTGASSSHLSSDFSRDEGGLLVGFGQRKVKRSITSRSGASSGNSSNRSSASSSTSSSRSSASSIIRSSASSSTSSSAFTSGSDDSSSEESSNSGSSSSSSSTSSDDDSDSSSDMDNIARHGLHIHSSRDSVSELSFGGASALMALQASRALHPNTANTAKEEEEEEEEDDYDDKLLLISSNESGKQDVLDSSSDTGKRKSVDVDQLEKLDEVSESTASDFLNDVSSIGDHNYAVKKFFSSPTNDLELTSNASDIWSSATSTDFRASHLLPSQGTSSIGDKSERKQEAKFSSAPSLSQDTTVIQQDLDAKDSPPLSRDSNGKPFIRRKSINSSKSYSSAASNGSLYQGVLARAAVMNQDDDVEDVAQLLRYSNGLENLLDASSSQHGSSQIEIEKSLQSEAQKSRGSTEPSKEASRDFSSAEDDLSSMSSVVSKARTPSKRSSFFDSGKGNLTKLNQEPKLERERRQHDKQSMSSGSYNGDDLYEDFPNERDDADAIRRNRSSASQAVSASVETDARRPWKTTPKEEVSEIADELALSVRSGSHRGSVGSLEQIKAGKKEAYEYNSDDDSSSDGSLSELFESKEALKKMGIYSSVIGPNAAGGSEEDVLSAASDRDVTIARSNIDPTKEQLDKVVISPQNDRDKKVGSLSESIRSSIQSIKEQLFGETKSNFSKSVSSRQSNGSETGLNDNGRQQQTQLQLSATSNDDSEGSLSFPKSDDASENPKIPPARVFANTAREISARLDHSISSRSQKTSKSSEEAGERNNVRSLNTTNEKQKRDLVRKQDLRKEPNHDDSFPLGSNAHDEMSVSNDSFDVESMIQLFKKKNQSVVLQSGYKPHHVNFDSSGDEDEEVGLPAKSYGEDYAASSKNETKPTRTAPSKNEAKPSLEGKMNRNGSKAFSWQVEKPHIIWGSVVTLLLIVLFSIIGSFVSKRNRSNYTSVPANMPTVPPSKLITNWVQVGNDLKGESPGDEAGFSVSASENGYTVIVGARRNGNTNDNTENRGTAQIFRFDASTGFFVPIWIYYGENGGDQCGFSVSMSKDGRLVAVGCPGSDTYGKNSGKVRLFMEEVLSKKWVMVSEVFGEGAGDLFGASVSLSQEGKHLAVGAPYYTRNDVKQSGSAYVYSEVKESVWQPSGSPMRGVVEQSLFGWSVSLSPSGKLITVGAPMSSESTDSGFVKIFSSEAEGSDFLPYGDISHGVPGDRFGFSVSMAGDETLQRVAIGAPGNNANGEGSGLATVYEHSDNGWSNAGDDLLGENQGENLGYSVSLTPDGSRLVVGVPKKQREEKAAGEVQVYNVQTAAITSAGGKYGLDGEMFGVSVTISNNGKRFFGGTTEANLVRVYEDIPVVIQ